MKEQHGDVNLRVNPNVKSKGETDVNLLEACKVQLSYEVVRWKTETLRVQKERDSAVQRAKELDQKIVKLNEKAKELEDSLRQAKDENKLFKSTSINSEKEKVLLMQRMSHSLNRFHSFSESEKSPKSEGSRLNRLNTSDFKRVPTSPEEDWREVSQKILERMKNEMKELYEVNSRHISTDENSPVVLNEADMDCSEIKEEISNLCSDTQSLKYIVVEQKNNLESLLRNITSGDYILKNQVLLHESKALDSNITNVQNVASFSPKIKFSNEDYPIHYTKELDTNHYPTKMAQNDEHRYTRSEGHVPENYPKADIRPSHSSLSQAETTGERSEIESEDLKKVCPICNLAFGVEVLQTDFEEHVVNHLEKQSESLLDQYVIV
ncbi:UBZ1-type domain-containing protein [Caerostris darwini]|uniref:UBZ1-type domain-containing protein n=1 Tax=Caerostris darwini TaxID=1538125 RepID=A0AAV4N8L1_9ARAC|nr:UBZ1-type domain-containing protein [Caerostris darwini]